MPVMMNYSFDLAACEFFYSFALCALYYILKCFQTITFQPFRWNRRSYVILRALETLIIRLTPCELFRISAKISRLFYICPSLSHFK